MITLEDLQKDLAGYKEQQEKMREAFLNMNGAIQLLTMQIDKLEKAEQEEVAEQAEELVEVD